MSVNLDVAWNLLSFAPVILIFFGSFSHIIFDLVLIVWILIVLHLFITTALGLHDCVVVISLVARIVNSCVKAFENNIGEFTLHESLINIRQNARWFSFNNTNVVNSSRTNSNDFFMHQRFYQLWSLAYGFNSIVICRIEWWRWHQGGQHSDVLIIVHSRLSSFRSIIIISWWRGSRVVTVKIRHKTKLLV